IAGADLFRVECGIGNRAAHGLDTRWIFHQYLFADCRGRTGAQSPRHSQDAFGRALDGPTAGVVWPAHLSIHLAVEPFGAMAARPARRRSGRRVRTRAFRGGIAPVVYGFAKAI